MTTATTFPIPEELVTTMRAARSIVVSTGAGVSAESGIPTFRDAQTGLWARFEPHELATPQAFRKNPQLVWEWYAWRQSLCAAASPNAGHYALATIEQRCPQFTLLTQNVDGLHRQAGSRNVVELHGNIYRTKCFDNEHLVETWPATDQVPPPCPMCGSLLRPDVVWFGERLPETALITAGNVILSCDLFFSIGTSGTVEPAASFPMLAMKSGATIVIVNPDVPALAQPGYYRLSGPSGVVLPALVQAVWP
jgi:NAD-dependent deacetylase